MLSEPFDRAFQPCIEAGSCHPAQFALRLFSRDVAAREVAGTFWTEDEYLLARRLADGLLLQPATPSPSRHLPDCRFDSRLHAPCQVCVHPPSRARRRTDGIGRLARQLCAKATLSTISIETIGIAKLRSDRLKQLAALASIHPVHWQAAALAAMAQPLNWLGILFLVGFFVLFATVLSMECPSRSGATAFLMARGCGKNS